MPSRSSTGQLLEVRLVAAGPVRGLLGVRGPEDLEDPLQAVLVDFRGSVYRCAAGFPPATDRRAYVQARAYVASTDRTWPFSFENLCDAIGLDADNVREELDLTGTPE